MPAVIVVIILAVLGIGAYLFTSADPDTTTSTVAEETTARPEETENTLEADTDVSTDSDDDADGVDDGTEEDGLAGTYEGSANYMTPARTEHTVNVELTLDNDGVVTAATVNYGSDGYDNDHQARFDAAYQSEVIGQQISDIELSSTGGASLTSGAFNEAVAEIEADLS